MSKKAKKIFKKIDPLMGGDVVLDKLGLPSVFGEKYGMMATPEMATGSEVAPVASAPTAVSDDTLSAREAQRRRQLAAAGMSGNILTGAGGLATGATTAGKSLLGS